MILDSVAADVATTDIVSGITANFMLQSLENAGIDLREPEAKAPKTQHEFKNKKKQKEYNLKPWRDIWSAGHGVGSINDIPTVSELVDRLRNEYMQACLGQQKNLVSLKNTCL